MPERSAESLLLVVLQDIVLIVLAVGVFWIGVSVARGLGRPARYSLAPLGLSKPGGGYLVGAGVGLLFGLGALVVSLALSPLSAYILQQLGYSTESNIQGPLMEGLSAWIEESPATAIPLIVAVVVLFGPAVEEFFFRGAIFGGLYRLGLLFPRAFGDKERRGVGEKVSFVIAALLSSALFALAHLEPALLAVLFVLALALCALYRRTGSLLPCFVAHATFNLFPVLLIILNGLGALPALP